MVLLLWTTHCQSLSTLVFSNMSQWGQHNHFYLFMFKFVLIFLPYLFCFSCLNNVFLILPSLTAHFHSWAMRLESQQCRLLPLAQLGDIGRIQWRNGKSSPPSGPFDFLYGNRSRGQGISWYSCACNLPTFFEFMYTLGKSDAKEKATSLVGSMW